MGRNQKPNHNSRSPAKADGVVNARRWMPRLVAVLAVLVYANTFQAGFTLDDVPIIEENTLIRSLANIPQIFKTNYWGEGDKPSDRSLYRPLTITSYAINFALHQLHPAGYHVTNVLLHALASVLLFFLARTLFDNEILALVAGALFAIHPVHTEAVAGIVGRAEILSLTGLLTCVLAYHRARTASTTQQRNRVWAWLALSVAGYVVALYSKEIGVIAPAVILLGEILQPAKRWLFRLKSPAIAAFAGYTVVFTVFMLMRQDAIRSKNINIGFLDVAPDDRVWTALRVGLEYIGLLVLPVRLSADYWITDVPLSRSPLEPGVIAAICAIVATGCFVIRYGARWPALGWGLGFFAVALFPVSNIPFAIGVMKAERILYTPSAGFIVALVALLMALPGQLQARRLGMVVLAGLAVFYAVRTWTRNPVWHDNHRLALATLDTSPQSPLFHNILAQEYRKLKPADNQAALRHLEISAEQNPRDATVWFNLGNTRLDLGHHDEAIRCYRHAIELAPNSTEYHLNLGMAHLRAGQYAQAAEIFERELKKRPHILALYFNLVSARVHLRQPSLALPVATEAVKRFPNNAGAWLNLSIVHGQLGRTNDALTAHAKAIALDPNIEKNRNQRSRLE